MMKMPSERTLLGGEMNTRFRPLPFLVTLLVASLLALAGLSASAGTARSSRLIFAANAAPADGATAAAIQAVIQKANQEQQDAFAQDDPTLMQDTSTPDYDAQMAQTNQALAASGVTAIQLVSLQWGSISLTDASTAQATTYETWQTTYDDGSVDRSRDRNVYTLVRTQGTWLIQSDVQPDASASGSSASTAPSGPIPSTPSSPAAPSGPIPPITSVGQSNTSENWSGYAATGGTFTAVSGTWTVPQSQGTSGATSRGGLATSATWVGIGGVTSRDLIQAGTDETVLGSGRTRYEAWIELLPRASHPIALDVSPGDSITVSIGKQGDGQWQIAFKDNTTGQTYQTTVSYTSSLSSAEWVEEAPSTGRSVLPLDNFGTVQFSGATTTENGKTETLSQAGAQAITMIDRYGNPIASPSAVSSDGKSFTVTQSTDSSASAGGFGLGPNSRAFPYGVPGVPWWLAE